MHIRYTVTNSRYKKTARLVRAALCLILVTMLPTAIAHSTQDTIQTFRGAYFQIQYPIYFQAIPSLLNLDAEYQDSVEQEEQTSERQPYDSAFFRSLDNCVEFYVYSPLWSGEPTDILPSSNEYLVHELKSNKRIDGLKRKAHWYTLKDKDGNYVRSVVDTIYQTDLSGSQTRVVFGLKYANQQCLNDYKEDYLDFKRSLQQFAD